MVRMSNRPRNTFRLTAVWHTNFQCNNARAAQAVEHAPRDTFKARTFEPEVPPSRRATDQRSMPPVGAEQWRQKRPDEQLLHDGLI